MSLSSKLVKILGKACLAAAPWRREMTLMTTFRTSILLEIAHGKQISLRTRLLFRRRLQNRVQRLLRKAFRDEQKRTGLTQRRLADRIGKDKSKVNQWLSIASNLTLETISDLLLGLGVDLDELSFTAIEDLVDEAARPELTKLEVKMVELSADDFVGTLNLTGTSNLIGLGRPRLKEPLDAVVFSDEQRQRERFVEMMRGQEHRLS